MNIHKLNHFINISAEYFTTENTNKYMILQNVGCSLLKIKYYFEFRRNSRVSSPHGTGPQRSMLAKEDDFDAIDGLSSSSRKVSIVEGKDGEVEIILEKDEPVIFTIFEAANIDGVQHLSSKNRCTR